MRWTLRWHHTMTDGTEATTTQTGVEAGAQTPVPPDVTELTHVTIDPEPATETPPVEPTPKTAEPAATEAPVEDPGAFAPPAPVE